MAATPETEVVAGIGNDYKYGFHDEENYFFKSGRGLSPELVASISEHKNEPEWMRKYRLKSLEYFRARPLPEWGGDLSGIDFGDLTHAAFAEESGMRHLTAEQDFHVVFMRKQLAQE